MNEQNSGSRMQRNKKTIAIAVVLGIAVSAVLGFSAVSVLAQENEGDVKAKPKIEGSANIGEVIKNFVEENRKVSFVTAAQTAENVLSEGKVVHGNFGVIQGYLVYTFMGVDNEQQKYKVIIDAGNGEILYQSDPIQMTESKKFHFADVSAELDLSEAATIAQAAVENGVVNMGMLRAQDDNAVYTFLVTDGEGTRYLVTIDADSGEVLDVSEGMDKPWGFHGKHHFGFGHGHKAYTDKDRDSKGTSSTGEQV